ncbi:hypothetical protein LXA43DRAFT_1100266 [Ganoderma leucocontextum]|nr:hypothetical protein LXA43DRAFT_1100266 [Ganoderma leucocontextum]
MHRSLENSYISSSDSSLSQALVTTPGRPTPIYPPPLVDDTPPTLAMVNNLCAQAQSHGGAFIEDMSVNYVAIGQAIVPEVQNRNPSYYARIAQKTLHYVQRNFVRWFGSWRKEVTQTETYPGPLTSEGVDLLSNAAYRKHTPMPWRDLAVATFGRFYRFWGYKVEKNGQLIWTTASVVGEEFDRDDEVVVQPLPPPLASPTPSASSSSSPTSGAAAESSVSSVTVVRDNVTTNNHVASGSFAGPPSMPQQSLAQSERPLAMPSQTVGQSFMQPPESTTTHALYATAPGQYPTPHQGQYPTPHPGQHSTPHPGQYLTPHPSQYPNPHQGQYPTPHPYPGQYSTHPPPGHQYNQFYQSNTAPPLSNNPALQFMSGPAPPLAAQTVVPPTNPAPPLSNSPALQFMSGPAPQFMSGPAPQFMSGPAPQFMSGPAPQFMSGPAPQFMSGPAPPLAAQSVVSPQSQSHYFGNPLTGAISDAAGLSPMSQAPMSQAPGSWAGVTPMYLDTEQQIRVLTLEMKSKKAECRTEEVKLLRDMLSSKDSFIRASAARKFCSDDASSPQSSSSPLSLPYGGSPAALSSLSLPHGSSPAALSLSLQHGGSPTGPIASSPHPSNRSLRSLRLESMFIGDQGYLPDGRDGYPNGNVAGGYPNATVDGGGYPNLNATGGYPNANANVLTGAATRT